MPAKLAASPDAVDLSSIWAALRARGPRLLISTAIVGAVSFAVLAMMAPRYQSESELAIVAKGQAGAFADSKGSSNNESITTKMDKEAINTHVRALQSPDLMAEIADQLDLKSKPEFNAALGPVDMVGSMLRLIGLGGPRSGESERDRVLDAFRDRLEVYSAKESRFIGVRFTSIEPEIAAEVANRLAEAYRASLASQGVSEIDDQQAVLQGKIDKLIPELAAIETEVNRYRGEINVFTGGSQNTGLNEQQLSELTGELTRAKSTRGEAEARARGAREMMKAGAADALPDVQKSPLIQNLVQQRVRIERQISELSATLLPGHPRMQQLNADLAGLKKQLTGEISKLVDSLEKEAKVAQGREDSIKASLDDLKKRVVNNAPEEAKLRQLEANAKAKRNELESLQGQLESNRKKLDARAQPVEAQLISKAQPSSVPVFPKKTSLSALIAVAWLMFGAAWTVTRALFDGARGSSAIAPRLAVNNAPLRREPALDAAKPLPAPVAMAQPAKTAAPADAGGEAGIDNLARRLAASRPSEGGHRTLITGETDAVDATAEAIGLAKALRSTGRHTILVEWGQSQSPASGPGFTELLFGHANFEDVVQRLPGGNVHRIAAGAPLDQFESDIDPDQLNLALDALDEAYDHIVVTGPHYDARALFEAIQGRFDAGVLVCEPRTGAPPPAEPGNSFLGFEVAEIDVIVFERKPAPTAAAQQRIARASGRNGVEARAV